MTEHRTTQPLIFQTAASLLGLATGVSKIDSIPALEKYFVDLDVVRLK